MRVFLLFFQFYFNSFFFFLKFSSFICIQSKKWNAINNKTQEHGQINKFYFFEYEREEKRKRENSVNLRVFLNFFRHFSIQVKSAGVFISSQGITLSQLSLNDFFFSFDLWSIRFETVFWYFFITRWGAVRCSFNIQNYRTLFIAHCSMSVVNWSEKIFFFLCVNWLASDRSLYLNRVFQSA